MLHSQVQIEFTEPQKEQREILRKNFYTGTALMAVVLFVASMLNDSTVLIALLKMAFSPIYMLGVTTLPVLFPRDIVKGANNSLTLRILSAAMSGLLLAFFMLVAFVGNENSTEYLAGSFVLMFVGMSVSNFIGTLYNQKTAQT